MASITIYSTGTCPICDKTKTFLTKKSIPFDEIRLDLDQSAHREFAQVTNSARTVPQITIEGKWIGSFTELTELHMDDELDKFIVNG